jgi:hypothetical protein
LLAYNEIAARGNEEAAARLRALGEAKAAGLYQFAGDLMRRGGDEFRVPVLNEAAFEIPRMRPIEGFKTMRGGQPGVWLTRTPYADLNELERLQIDACADLIIGTMFADLWPTRVAVDGPESFSDGGDIVGVRTLATRWSMKRGMTFDRAIHVLGVAGKALGIAEANYGQSRRRNIARLVEIVTGEPVSDKQLRTLWLNRAPLERTRRAGPPLLIVAEIQK